MKDQEVLDRLVGVCDLLSPVNGSDYISEAIGELYILIEAYRIKLEA